MAVLADSAYGSGELRAELAERGHLDRVKPAPLRSAVPGGFTVDLTRQTVTCPAQASRNITVSGNAIFGKACRSCALRAQCTAGIRSKTLRATA